MQKVNPTQALQRVNSQQTSTGRNEDRRKETINKLFGVIKVAYPNFLNNQNESETKRMWLMHLGGYAESKIESAAGIMVDRHPTWPPTLGEFKKLIAEMNVARPELQTFKALPPPAAKESVAKQHIALMRAALR